MQKYIFKKNSKSGVNHKVLSILRWNIFFSFFLMEDPFKSIRDQIHCLKEDLNTKKIWDCVPTIIAEKQKIGNMVPAYCD